METINITSQLTLRDYLKVNYQLIYKRGITIFFNVMGLLMVAFSIFSLISLPEEPIKMLPMAVMGCVLLLVYPISTYFSYSKIYKTTRRIGETINYTFDQETIRVKGESFESTSSWDKIYQVSATKGFLLIWESKVTAHIIAKRYISPEELDRLKEIVKIYPNIKNKLK